MNGFTIILATICAFFSSSVIANDRFLCVTDLVSGFSFNRTSMDWENATFNAGSKYVISRPEDGSSVFVVHEIGKPAITSTCGKDFDEQGSLSCNGYGGEFRFNRKSGRFINSYLAGYYNVIPGVTNKTDENSDTPTIEIGKCSPF